MKYKQIYIGAALLAFSVVSCENEIETGEQGGQNGTPLELRASVRSGEEGLDLNEFHPFASGKKIRVYYAHTSLNNTYDFLQGIYSSPGTADKKDVWTPEPDQKSIYIEDIKAANSDGKYMFTATSYPEPHVDGEAYNVYKVPTDQAGLASDFGEYDFLAARAVYTGAEWNDVIDPGNANNGVTLHFRHLLSQLRVQLILPKGSTNDGFFTNPEKVDLVTSPTVLGKQSQYSVTYNNTKETGEIFGITPLGNPSDIKMLKIGTPEKVVGKDAYCHTFSVVLPKQNFVKSKLLSFVIGGKSYSYTPPAANTVLLEQEKITTIQLTVLSGPGNQKLVLNKVTIEGWNEDYAKVGDLIPQ